MCKVEVAHDESDLLEKARSMRTIEACLRLGDPNDFQWQSHLAQQLTPEIHRAVHEAEEENTGHTLLDDRFTRPLLLYPTRKHFKPGEVRPGFDDVLTLEFLPSPTLSQKVDTFFDQNQKEDASLDREEKLLKSLLPGI